MSISTLAICYLEITGRGNLVIKQSIKEKLAINGLSDLQTGEADDCFWFSFILHGYRDLDYSFFDGIKDLLQIEGFSFVFSCSGYAEDEGNNFYYDSTEEAEQEDE
jgi:hypothetical protein